MYVEVIKRIQTDVVFRWFLNLGINDSVPDDTTLSFFRIQRLTEKHFEAFFTEIVKKCIEKDFIRTNRFIIDSTDVAANVNYLSIKKLARIAFNKVRQAVAECALFDISDNHKSQSIALQKMVKSNRFS